MARPPWLDRLYALPEQGPESICVDDKLHAHLLIEQLEPGLREGAVPDDASLAIKLIKLHLDKAAVAAQPGTAPSGGPQAEDKSSELMRDFLPPLRQLPNNHIELAEILQDYSGISIPVIDHHAAALKRELNAEHSTRIRRVSAANWVAVGFTKVLLGKVRDAGSELATTFAVFDLLETVRANCAQYVPNFPNFRILLNKTERGAGSISAAIKPRGRPDSLIVEGECTYLLGEDQDKDMYEAVGDLKKHIEGGLNARHYGDIMGLPAYGAADMELRFFFIGLNGKVEEAGSAIDLRTVSGRFTALCRFRNLFRLLMLMEARVPTLPHRLPLWQPRKRGMTTVMLSPRGASKTIDDFSGFANLTGTNKDTLLAAYAAATCAADERKRHGQLPFLVSGQASVTRNVYTAVTAPLGFRKSVTSEQEARYLAWGCLQGVRVLHKEGIVHSDLRDANTAWLSDQHCMVIDLECCRRAADPLPTDTAFHQLTLWTDDPNGLETKHGRQYYTERSDLYYIGKMLQAVMHASWTPEAHGFVEMLLEMPRTHQQQQQQEPEELEQGLHGATTTGGRAEGRGAKRGRAGAQQQQQQQQQQQAKKKQKRQQQKKLDVDVALEHAWLQQLRGGYPS